MSEPQDAVITVGEEPVGQFVPAEPVDVPVEPHTHEDGEVHDHDHEPDPTRAFMPQPIPMGIQMQMVKLQDGSENIQVVFASANGQWVVFFDRQGAIQHAQSLLGLAYSPPSQPEEPTPTPDA